MAAMPQLRALGSPLLTADDGSTINDIMSQTKRLVLLVYLADGDPVGCRRDSLLAAFWPELNDANARNALRQALSMLRRGVGEDVLPAERGETVRLEPDRLTFDVAQFLRALGGGDLAGALALYRGDFLAGVHVADVPEVERWMDDRRSSLRRKAVRAALALAEQAGASGDQAAPVSWAHRAVTMAPHDELAWRKLIELQIRQGNAPAALGTYDKLCRLLRDEFDGAPSTETRALIAPLRRVPP